MLKIDKEKAKYEEFKKQLLRQLSVEQSGYSVDEIQRRIEDEALED